MGSIEKLTLYSLILLLIWGNMVSGLGHGLACPDWPLCFGQFFPEINFPIFMEHGHRVLGLIVSVFFFFLAKDRLRKYVGKQKILPFFAGFLLLIQIVLGGLVVIFQLETNLTTFHFSNAIAIFLLIYTMCKYPSSDSLKAAKFFTLKSSKYIFFFVIIYIQLILGAYVRHSNAGLACPDFPICLGFWLPPYLSKTVFLHLMHRVWGFVILFYALFLLLYTYKSKIYDQFKRVRNLLLLILVQIALGIYVVVSKLAFSMTAIHLFVALMIIMIALDAIFDENNAL